VHQVAPQPAPPPARVAGCHGCLAWWARGVPAPLERHPTAGPSRLASRGVPRRPSARAKGALLPCVRTRCGGWAAVHGAGCTRDGPTAPRADPRRHHRHAWATVWGHGPPSLCGRPHRGGAAARILRGWCGRLCGWSVPPPLSRNAGEDGAPHDAGGVCRAGRLGGSCARGAGGDHRRRGPRRVGGSCARGTGGAGRWVAWPMEASAVRSACRACGGVGPWRRTHP